MENRIEKIISNCYHNGIPLSCILRNEEIERLSENEDSDIRMCLAKALAFDDTNSSSVSILSRLAEDMDVFVRIEAVDSLSVHICKTSYLTLCSAIEDTDELVRAYAIYGIALIGKKLLIPSSRNILDRIKIEDKSDYVKVMVHTGLFILGDEEELHKLHQMFGHYDYHINCFVLRALQNLLYFASDSNKSLIRQFISSIDESTLPIAVKEAYFDLRNSLQGT